MLNYRALALLFALPTMATGQARAAEEISPADPSIAPGVMVIDAQQLEVFVDKQMRAVGDAEMRQDDKAIFGDRIDYNELNQELHVVGNTRIEQSSGLVVKGPELRMRMDEREGEMKEPVFTFTRQPDPTTVTASPLLPGTRIYDPDSTAVRAGSIAKAPVNFARGDAQ